QHSDLGRGHTMRAGPGTRIRYTITQDTMFVDMWEVAPGLRNQGVGRELFPQVLAAHPNVRSIRGIAELDNLAVLRRTGDVAQTPFAQAVRPLGFEQCYAENPLGQRI